jgi:hypothetical protein
VHFEISDEVIVGEASDILRSLVSIQVKKTSAMIPLCKYIETIGEMTGHVVRTNNASWAVKFDSIGEEGFRLSKYLKPRFEKD